MNWYHNKSEKRQGSFTIQNEKICKLPLCEGGGWKDSIWMWWGGLSDKGQCNGILYHASIDSKSNIRVQDDSLQWKYDWGGDAVLKFNCVNLKFCHGIYRSII